MTNDTMKFDYSENVVHWQGTIWETGIPNKLEAVIEWLQEQLADIPEACRASAKLDIFSVDGAKYEGEHHAEICIVYSRPPTATEIAHRMQRAERVRQERISFIEQELRSLRVLPPKT